MKTVNPAASTVIIYQLRCLRSVERCNWLGPHLGLFAFYCYGDAVDAFDAEAVQVGGVAAGFDLTVSSSEGFADAEPVGFTFYTASETLALPGAPKLNNG